MCVLMLSGGWCWEGCMLCVDAVRWVLGGRVACVCYAVRCREGCMCVFMLSGVVLGGLHVRVHVVRCCVGEVVCVLVCLCSFSGVE